MTLQPRFICVLPGIYRWSGLIPFPVILFCISLRLLVVSLSPRNDSFYYLRRFSTFSLFFFFLSFFFARRIHPKALAGRRSKRYLNLRRFNRIVKSRRRFVFSLFGRGNARAPARVGEQTRAATQVQSALCDVACANTPCPTRNNYGYLREIEMCDKHTYTETESRINERSEGATLPFLRAASFLCVFHRYMRERHSSWINLGKWAHLVAKCFSELRIDAILAFIICFTARSREREREKRIVGGRPRDRPRYFRILLNFIHATKYRSSPRKERKRLSFRLASSRTIDIHRDKIAPRVSTRHVTVSREKIRAHIVTDIREYVFLFSSVAFPSQRSQR